MRDQTEEFVENQEDGPMTENVKTLLVRLPVEVKQWLEEESDRNLSSQTSEVVRAVRLRMESERHRSASAA